MTLAGGCATLAAVQASSAWLDLDSSVDKACRLIHRAGASGADFVVFPENFIPGHPSWFHYMLPGQDESDARALRLLEQSVSVPGNQVGRIQQAAQESSLTVVMGMTERMDGASGTLYNTQLVIDPSGSILGKHQKLVPTKTERMVHAPGSRTTQRTFHSPLGEMSSLICGENSNPLALGMIAANHPVVHAASWPAHVSPSSSGGVRGIAQIMSQAVAHMLGCFVVSAAGVNSEEMISDIAQNAGDEEFLRDPEKNGGALIVGPSGALLAGPLPGGVEDILYAKVDLIDCIKSRLAIDVGGHYNRADVYQLKVNNSPDQLVATIVNDGLANVAFSDSAEPSKFSEGMS